MTHNGMITLKRKLYYIASFIDNKDNVVYLDYPLHHNVGDLLIFEGVLEFFKEHGIKPKKKLNIHNATLAKLNKIITPDTTIICHGGGNFGDIYKPHQQFRELVVQSYPNNKIIVLPQTVFFSNEDNLKKSRKIFHGHGNIILFARDKLSFDILKEFSDKVYLMPDMAHQLYGEVIYEKLIKKDTLYFFRKDIEKSSFQNILEKNINSSDIYDWDDLLTKQDHKLLSIIFRVINLNKKLKINILDELLFILWHKHSHRLMDKYAKRFSTYDKIVTSRLHGYILSCLVDTTSSLVDNSYGKNTSYFDTWGVYFNNND